MIKQKGFATILAVALIIAAFGTGMVFKHYTDHIDHPIEEAAENVLDNYGIDVDFSREKKAKQKNGN